MAARCIVTGASGLLGREVVARLCGRFEVLGLSHRERGDALVPVDLREPEQIRALVREFPPDVVVHCAAYRDPDFCEARPDETRRLNVNPVRVFCKVLPPQATFVFISSDYVFDGESPPYNEDDPVCPVNLYGQSKVEAERIARGRDRTLVVRSPLLVGAGPTFERSGFVAQTFLAVKGRKRLDLDDVLVRFPTWTRDVARAVDFLLERDATGTFHVSGPQGGTRYGWTVEMARLLEEPCGHLRPADELVLRKAARPPDSQLATDKIMALGFAGFASFQEAAVSVLETFHAG